MNEETPNAIPDTSRDRLSGAQAANCHPAEQMKSTMSRSRTPHRSLQFLVAEPAGFPGLRIPLLSDEECEARGKRSGDRAGGSASRDHAAREAYMEAGCG